MVKLDLEPVIDILVQLVVLVAQLLRRHTLLDGLGLGGSAVFICSANVKGRVASRLAVARKDVG